MWIHRYIPKTKELLALEGIEGDCEQGCHFYVILSFNVIRYALRYTS